ncbi:MAG: thiamine pyrophosphate-dependent dehydrogenase E1 component subunit alpha [Proteobacteria bacterium]|nr:thiamine pyrophosphate-dependent dehydrogenase E1 component subunit alpha [Pseudomonadota bacterium]
MVKSRMLEERLITMFKQSHGFFWIGGPGEEAFNVPLGLLIKKGLGLDYDYLHLHYRSSAILIAMGMDPLDAIRQMKNTVTDPHSGGRNFSSHYSIRKWNVTPITSPIEVQYAIAIGTGIAQKDHGGDAITIVNGGDAGTAEGDFASCLVWSSRPGNELPILIIVTNNQWGISTHAATQHGEKNIADRGKAFGIKSQVINGNDVSASYEALQQAIDYVRAERKPFLLEAKVSRLYGHSSASGAMLQTHEADPLSIFEQKLIQEGTLTSEQAQKTRQNYEEKFRELADQVKNELQPDPDSIYDFTYWQQRGKGW